MTASTTGRETCLVCGYSGPFRAHFAGLARCPGCGFVEYQAVTPEELDDLYDEEYFTGAEYPDYLGQERALRRTMRRHLAQMHRAMAPGGALLDIGCAYGIFLDEAKRHYDPVVGVDVCEVPVRYAREHLGLDAHEGDVRQLELEPGSFDVVCMWDTIEHVPDPDEFLDRAMELLRPGGRLFLTTGDIGALVARARGRHWRQIHPPTHLNYFSRETMSRLVERIDFEVVRMETASYFHTIYNILAGIQMRPGLMARPAGFLLSLLDGRLIRRAGLWINLGDVMFVEARRPQPSPPDGAP